jgi:hypothetical protein
MVQGMDRETVQTRGQKRRKAEGHPAARRPRRGGWTDCSWAPLDWVVAAAKVEDQSGYRL